MRMGLIYPAIGNAQTVLTGAERPLHCILLTGGIEQRIAFLPFDLDSPHMPQAVRHLLRKLMRLLYRTR